MSDITRTEKIKIIKTSFEKFNKDNDFYFLKPTLIIKDNYDIAHYLIIAPRFNRTVCDIVAQPLYIPESTLSLNISTRLQQLGETHCFPWGRCTNSVIEYSKDIEEILQIFSEYGLQWLSYFDSPQHIIDSANNWNLSKYQFPWIQEKRNEVIAISSLYLGDIEKGIFILKKLQDDVSDSISFSQRIEKWLRLAQNESERLPEIFDEIVLTTRKNLKLKDEKCELLNKRQEEQINSIILP